MSGFPRSFWFLLLAGVALRCLAIREPLIDSGILRQTQTAMVTRGLMEAPAPALSTKLPWIGDVDARLVLELPVYNYLVIAVYRLVGDLDLSGKVTSVSLWAASFFLLQLLWRRMLEEAARPWANGLFVFAPLSVFYSQAFMPEMLVQALGFAFLLATLRYDDHPTLPRWLVVTLVGLLGLLAKFPAISHLYLFLILVLFHGEGWRIFLRPRYLLAAVVTVAALIVWGHYVDSINSVGVPRWTSHTALKGFVGTFGSRFTFKPWAMLSLYLGVFVFAGPAAFLAGSGLWLFLRRNQKGFLGLWLLSLLLFYLTWFGDGSVAQAYYNLPALGGICALFGIGASRLLSFPKFARHPRTSAFVVLAVLLLCTIPILQYLFKQDRQIYSAAVWTREHTQPDDLILFRAQHRWDMVDYYYNAVPAYYSERRSFVITRLTPDAYREAALQRARYAVVTLPVPAPGGALAVINRFRGVAGKWSEPLDWLEAAGFVPFVREEGFVVYYKN